MNPHFLVHNSSDTVGVAAVEDIKKDQLLTGWVMDEDRTVRVRALDHIPLGHKVALVDMQVDDSVTKYGHDIGRVVAPVKRGGHVHVHNVKTRRW